MLHITTDQAPLSSSAGLLTTRYTLLLIRRLYLSPPAWYSELLTPCTARSLPVHHERRHALLTSGGDLYRLSVRVPWRRMGRLLLVAGAVWAVVLRPLPRWQGVQRWDAHTRPLPPWAVLPSWEQSREGLPRWALVE